MSVTAVIGGQWGDEGKGRVVDYLAQRAEMVIRYQGGDNAGHTVVNEFGLFKLHMVPSGIFNPETVCIVGAGCAVNPPAILEEMEQVAEAGVSLDNMFISQRAHVVFPFHRLIDGLEESARSGDDQIGTTRRGIGPTYADKAARLGIRVGDLRRPDYLRRRLTALLDRKNSLLERFGAPTLDLEEVLAEALEWGEALGGRIVDTLPLVQEAITDNQNVLLEGQLGIMRDLDWGIYPYVTSSNPMASGAYMGAGLPPGSIDEVVGVVKAYSTAVGGGPFPVELLDDDGEQLREVGKEYGATTGRPRRCGWFDGVAIRYSAWLNGFSTMAVTKLDVLDDFEEIKICVGYELDGEVIDTVPDTPDLERVTPVYESWEGWQCSTREARTWDDLPKAARAYLHRMSELAGVPFRYVSVGPERPQLVVLDTFGVRGIGFGGAKG